MPLQPPASIRPRIGNQQRAQPDQDELQHFVEDRREQPAQRHVDRHGERRDPDAEVDVPAQHHLHHQRHRVHVDAAHQHGHEARTRRRRARALASPKRSLQIARHRVGLGDVIERHHHEAEEQHGGDGADPIPVRGQDAVLIGGRGPAHQFQRAEVGGEEAQPGDPGRHLAAGQEEVLAGLRRSPSGRSRCPGPATK